MLISAGFWRSVHLCRFTATAIFGLLMAAASAEAAATATTDENKETVISARMMHSDQNTGIVTATGQVEIAHAGYILHADRVTYNQKNGVMHADGHVAMLTPSGDVEFSDSEDVTGDMKQSFAQNMSILFPDSSQMIAKHGQRYDGRYMVADTASYTACNLCKEKPDQSPLWQINADSVVHDNVEHEIYYHNATVDFAGVPLLYTPYMSTPDPTVDRRQGLLSPTPGYTPTLGLFVRQPYYIDIDPDKDATLSLLYSKKAHFGLGADYRERFAQGMLTVDGSVARTDLANGGGTDLGKKVRGHFFENFVYDINDTWRAGSDVNIASDKTYLPAFRYSASDRLTTRNYVERFSGRSYTDISQYWFEDMRSGTTAVQPIVLPRATFSAMGEPGQTFGGRWSLDANTLLTTRQNDNQGLAQQGPDTRRVAVNGGWERQLVSDQTGFVTRLSGLMHLDAYSADNVIDPTTSHIYNKVTLARQFEQANAMVSYPLSRSGNGYYQVLEPIVALTVAPAFHNSVQQPIEDSGDVSFDETNLFSPNRFTGYDLIEGGSRATYGLRNVVTTDAGGRVDLFGGQSYDFTPSSSFTTSSGLHDHASDYVGRLGFSPNKYIDMSYSFRLDRKTLEPQRQYATTTFGVPLFRPSLRYTSGYSLDANGNIQKIDDATIGFDTTFQQYWTFHIDHTQGFDPGPGPRSTAAILSYTDECFIGAISVSQSDTQQIGLTTGTSVLFHIFLRNLGGIHTDSTQNGTFPTEFRRLQ